jgi:prepilin-type N-terminal cleavage/methylation domain-containing protein
MRRLILPPAREGGFTLAELLTVMAIIAILAALILSISGWAQKKAALNRAQAEIKALEAGCENYKNDNGTYPDIVTTGSATVSVSNFTSNIPSDSLDPRTNGNPGGPALANLVGTTGSYEGASFELYVALTSDTNGTQQTLTGTKNYIPDIKPDALGRANMTVAVSTSNPVQYLSDPFGNSYGYSTINSFYQAYLTAGGAPKTTSFGYNPTFDLWCTGGVTSAPLSPPGTAGDPALQWVNNWSTH